MALRPLLTGLLKDVSRSFYLTLRVLPGAIRPQISLAYLLARTTDTVADTALIPPQRRLDTLRQMRNGILGLADRLPDFKAFTAQQANAAEAELLTRFPEACGLLAKLEPADGDRIRHLLSIIVSGQELDLERFSDAASGQVIALQTERELDDYTYRVAGCVGEFWTQLCLAHLFRQPCGLGEAALLAHGVRFGKGLQLVNILRDLATDLRQGRCYLPAQKLRALGLAPADLQSNAAEARLRPLYDDYLAFALGHLKAGWDYVEALPRSQVRVRLACAWPILIGIRTLERLRLAPIHLGDKVEPMKIGRREVYSLVLGSLALYPWRTAWSRLARFEHINER
jgi:farnesyl-diphosphate farnesyltransferase